MCLSLKLVSNWVKISSFLVLVLGVIGIICAAYIGKDDIMVSSVKDTKNTIMAVTITFSVFLMLIGLSGVIGVWRKSSWCLLIYNIGIGIFFVAFLVISIVAFAVFKKYYAVDFKNTEICKSQEWLSPINAVAVRGESYLCSSSCACNSHTPFPLLVETNNTSNETINNSANNISTSNTSTSTSNTSASNTSASNTSASNTSASNTSESNTSASNTSASNTSASNTSASNTSASNTSASNTSASNTSASNTSTSNTSSNTSSNRIYNYSINGSVRAQDCPNYAQDFSALEREYAVSMEILEKQFKCAGVCQNSEFYSFSDINIGSPKDDCATILVDIFVAYSKKIGAATIVMTILLFITLIASFCFCCHPEKRKEQGGFYQKMSSV